MNPTTSSIFNCLHISVFSKAPDIFPSQCYFTAILQNKRKQRKVGLVRSLPENFTKFHIFPYIYTSLLTFFFVVFYIIFLYQTIIHTHTFQFMNKKKQHTVNFILLSSAIKIDKPNSIHCHKFSEEFLPFHSLLVPF